MEIAPKKVGEPILRDNFDSRKVKVGNRTWIGRRKKLTIEVFGFTEARESLKRHLGSEVELRPVVVSIALCLMPKMHAKVPMAQQRTLVSATLRSEVQSRLGQASLIRVYVVRADIIDPSLLLCLTPMSGSSKPYHCLSMLSSTGYSALYLRLHIETRFNIGFDVSHCN